ncbi:MAG: hypothetical protein Q7K57_19915, partial [Burkholderiaceae bacterium]|nr:hypothetical protein [Burkholderiaceae bacterium]
MSYNINDAFLAKQIYDVQTSNGTYTSPDGNQWTVIDRYSYPDGYQGVLFQNTTTGKYEFVSRGTEANAGDVYSDWQMGIGRLPDQLISARESLQRAQASIGGAGGNPDDITLVGHSLGGSLTQMLAAENPQLQAQAFNPYGTANLLPPGDYSNITNHVMYLDPVSVLVGSKMPGVTQAYSEQDLVGVPVVPGWVWPVFPPSETVPSHSSDRFLDPYVSQQSGQLVTIDVFPLGEKLSNAIKTAAEAMQNAGKSIADTLTTIGGVLQNAIPQNFFPHGKPFPPGGGPEGSSLSDSLKELGDALKAAAQKGAIPGGVQLFGISDAVYDMLMAALNWVAPRRDPLVLDLDGGGITTSAINPNAPILFDQDGDGTKTATGWIASGEAIVVRDLNGNGTIDSGRELFGDNTILTTGPRAGQTAANGFEALADLDSNGDGKFSNLDTAFASVKLWKDANQNGISEAGELFTFAQLGVASIDVSGTASNLNLGGGNTQTFAGSFTTNAGSTGAAGTAQLAGSLLLANNNFYRQFTDDPVLISQAQALPQMQGSGLVRDLRPAMSLGSAQALDLQTKLAEFAADTTKAQQYSHLDALVQSWGATSAMQTSLQTNLTLANTAAGANSITAIAQFAQNNSDLYAQITALERFNGNTILDKWVRASGSFNVVSYSAQQEAFIHQAYDALKSSVYEALVVQTRLRPYLDSIGLVVDEAGVHFDTTATIAAVQSKAATDTFNAVTDLIDLQKYAAETLLTVGWDLYKTMKVVLDTATITPALQSLLTEGHIVLMGATDTNYNIVETAPYIVFGNSLGNTLVGGSENSHIYGGDGNDTITASGGNDVLDGGAGNDVITEVGGGTSILRGGDGNDTINFSHYA